MSINFNGTNQYWYTQENPAALNGLTAYTHMCWVRPVATGGFRTCYSRQVGTGGNETIWSGHNGTSFGTFISTTSGVISVFAGTIQFGVWAHVAVVYLETVAPRAFLFINGVQAGSTVGTGGATLTATTRGLLVAANNNGVGLSPAEYFGGDLEDLRIYNRAMGAAEISTIMTSLGKDGIVAGLLCRIPMLGPSGQTDVSIANIQGDPSLSLITQGNSPVYAPSITTPSMRPHIF